jgi:hypothetical protein
MNPCKSKKKKVISKIQWQGRQNNHSYSKKGMWKYKGGVNPKQDQNPAGQALNPKAQPVASGCNPSYSGGRDQEDHRSKPAQGR